MKVIGTSTTADALHALYRAREAARAARPNVYRTHRGDLIPVLELAADEPRNPDGTRACPLRRVK